MSGEDSEEPAVARRPSRSTGSAARGPGTPAAGSSGFVARDSGFRAFLGDSIDDAREWCRGRSALVRAPLLAYLAYASVRHLFGTVEYSDFFGGITFGIHELGHIVLAPLGHFISALGGSLFQVLAPVAALLVFRRQRDWFGMSVALFWLASSLWGLGYYVGDARAERLDLIGPGDDPEHDWHYVLGATGLLAADRFFQFALHAIAFGLSALSVGGGGWLLFRMSRKGTDSGLREG